MAFNDQTVAILLLVALGAVVVLAAAAVVLALRMGRLRRAYASALAPDGTDDVFAALERQQAAIEGLRTDVGVVHGNTEMLRELLESVTSRVAVIRYDAFDDMGGALSFSAALLDESGNGVVLSAINGRTETRTYAKPVVAGESEYNLSGEEEAVIESAMAGDLVADPSAVRRRRRRVAS